MLIALAAGGSLLVRRTPDAGRAGPGASPAGELHRDPPTAPARPAAPAGSASRDAPSARWLAALDRELDAALASLDAARRTLAAHRSPRGPVPASAEEARALRLQLESLASRPLGRDDALAAEWLDARLRLRAGQWEPALQLLRGLAAEPMLPASLPREGILALLPDVERGSSLVEMARCSARRAVGLGREALRLGRLAEAELAALEARTWAAQVAVAASRAEGTDPSWPRELVLRLERCQGLPAEGPSRDRALATLSLWTGVAFDLAERLDDMDAALAILAVLPSAPGGWPETSSRDQRRLRSRLLEARGKERRSTSPLEARDDLLAAAQLRFELAREAEDAEMELRIEEAAALHALADDPRGGLRVLAASGTASDESLLLQGRLRMAAGDPATAITALDRLLVPRGADRRGAASREAVGPIVEEARLIRAVARLRLATGGGERRSAAAARELLTGAGEDLRFLIENLDAAAPVCQTALFYRALQLESEALAFASISRNAAGEATGRIAAAAALLERWLVERREAPSAALVVGLDRLAALEVRLGRWREAQATLEQLARLEASDLQRDGSRLAVLLEYPEPLVAAILEEAPYRLADWTARAGEPQRALAAYETALARSPQSLLAPWARLRRAEIYRSLGQEARAAEETSRVLAALGPEPPEEARSVVPPELVDAWRRALRGRAEGR